MKTSNLSSFIFKAICGLSLMFSLTQAQTPKVYQAQEIPEVDEKLIENLLPRLIYGFQCEQMRSISHFDPSVLWVKDNDKIDAQKVSKKIHYIRFAGKILNGGILDSKSQAFISPDREFMYFLKASDLVVQNICDKQQFALSNYDKESDAFHLKLRNKPAKEVAIVLNVADSMKDYVLAFKEIAPFMARHIFKDELGAAYAKITLVTFSSYDVKDFGDVIDEQDFIANVKTLQTKKSPSKMVNYALIQAMSHFTKDNGLKKEIYLITDSAQSDKYNTDRMLKLTKNLNDNIVYNSKGSKDNWVKIHTFSLKQNATFLRDLAKETGGDFYAPNGIYEFKKALLKLSNDGKDVDPSEMKSEIIPSKTHKIYDPDNPDNPIK